MPAQTVASTNYSAHMMQMKMDTKTIRLEFKSDIIRVVNEGQETVVLFRAIFSAWTELLLCQLCMERYAIGMPNERVCNIIFK